MPPRWADKQWSFYTMDCCSARGRRGPLTQRHDGAPVHSLRGRGGPATLCGTEGTAWEKCWLGTRQAVLSAGPVEVIVPEWH